MIETIQQRMKKNIFISIGGKIEHVNALVDMLAYYKFAKHTLVKTKNDEEIRVAQITKLRTMAKNLGYNNYAEINNEANKIVRNVRLMPQTARLIKELRAA